MHLYIIYDTLIFEEIFKEFVIYNLYIHVFLNVKLYNRMLLMLRNIIHLILHILYLDL